MGYLFAVPSAFGLAVLVGGEPTMSDLLLGAASGLGASMGLIQLYRGYTTMGAATVGPVAAVTSAVIPVIASAIFEGLHSAVVGYGILVGIAAVWMISIPDISISANGPAPSCDASGAAAKPTAPRYGTGLPYGTVWRPGRCSEYRSPCWA